LPLLRLSLARFMEDLLFFGIGISMRPRPRPTESEAVDEVGIRVEARGEGVRRRLPRLLSLFPSG
jgi:hypothetical protein